MIGAGSSGVDSVRRRSLLDLAKADSVLAKVEDGAVAVDDGKPNTHSDDSSLVF